MPVVEKAVAKGHIPTVAPGNIRLVGTKKAMAELAPQLETLHACLHSPDEDIRLATIRTLAQRGVSVVYGPPLVEEAQQSHGG